MTEFMDLDEQLVVLTRDDATRYMQLRTRMDPESMDVWDRLRSPWTGSSVSLRQKGSR